ncbi:MAG: phosphoglucosamine mutase [Saprospiraceae bacterium]
MALIKSISGIRGTIGGYAGDNLTPEDIVTCTAAFGYWILQNGHTPKVVIGRDGRVSGALVSSLVSNTLLALGIDVVDLGYSTTPTVEMAVPWEKAGAGIILTASHNPMEWNALKLLNHQGEFISQQDGEAFLQLLEKKEIRYASVSQLGNYSTADGYIGRHVAAILQMDLVDVGAIRQRKFKVVVDCINSTGAMAMPHLLRELGCEVVILNGEINGQFAHNPEPLPAHMQDLMKTVISEKADLGIAVDPDVDRLAFVAENGELFGEEYTLVAVADYILHHKKGATVSNLSSTRALRDVTRKHGCQYYAAAVGEVNVVHKMKEVNAVIGGEGNGGVIVPDLHYGRDALAGTALFLSHLVQTGKTMSALRADYPNYAMVKDKISLTPDVNMEQLLSNLHEKYKNEDCNIIDGLKIDFSQGWVHLRKSNTEPIIRVYAESNSEQDALALVEQLKTDAMHFI